MKSILKNIAAVVIGLIVGSVVNMALVTVGPMAIPLPEGADDSSMENLRDSIELFSPKHFIFPFLAHALGTLIGAFITAKIAASHAIKLAMLVGIFFLVGGVMAAKMIGGPLWFNLTDLVLAYLPMAYLGGRLGKTK